LKLTKREAALLIILLVFALLFIEYKLIVIPGLTRYEELVKKDQEVQAKVDETNILINSIPKVKANKESVLADISAKSQPFYGQLNSDALLRNTYDLLIKSGLIPEAFDSSSVETKLVSVPQSKILELSYKLKKLVNDYSNAAKSIDSDSQKPAPTPTPIPNSGNPPNKAESNVESYSITIKASGTYDQLKGFISSIEKLNKTVFVSTLVLGSTGKQDVISTSLKVTFYGVEKIEQMTDQTNIWHTPDYTAGTGNPFSQIISVSPTPIPTGIISPKPTR